ncbi:serine/threonine-protein kinase [Allokutzneria albata]|uniref:non-specific serine/threonine protein kinase n=1 Tax=Allokutzneria albata TaxID=211114 RepID=A0A1H0B9K2_ALLAB|nr:serine/threonine-protein kinase [Allokutzneria albata]SDN42292.1 Serine/threonine protein kinase [Allokutzneria albata]
MPPADEDKIADTTEPSERLIAERYRLKRVLGRGAMGTVWAAYDEMLRRQVAVKEVRLPPGMPPEEADAMRERTLREARAIAVLSHPNVVTLFDVVRHEGEPFVVMELLPSRSLAQLVRKHGPLNVTQTAEVGNAVAAALAAAHQAGVTHRDVKPGNVLVGADGRVKLTDFGIARSVTDSTLTSAGLLMGTPAYIAPEVASGDPASPSADLWGLGATLFAAMEGTPPYDVEDDPLETVTQVVHGEVPTPSDEGVLGEVIRGLMVKNPEDRMPLAEVRRRLHPLLPEPGSSLFPHDETEPSVAPNPVVEQVKQRGSERRRAVEASMAKELAADPGPLPFMLSSPPPPPPRRRSTRLLTVACAVVLFVVSAGGGFALARTVAGQDVVPDFRTQEPPKTTPVQSAPLAPLEQRNDVALLAKGDPGGAFSLNVPKNWTDFQEQRPSSPMPSTLIRFISPDGHNEVAVERFAGFYPHNKISRYLDQLNSIATSDGGDFNLLTQNPAAGQNSYESARDLIYRTSSPKSGKANSRGRAAATEVHRTTYALLLPNGKDLWVLRVTVPTDSEEWGKIDLYDRILPTFAIAS